MLNKKRKRKCESLRQKRKKTERAVYLITDFFSFQ